MNYKDAVTLAMTAFGQHPDTCAIGYNCKHGRAAGTLAGFPEQRLFEMPLAENLMCGAAIGLSLQGFIPIIWMERMDFILCAMDAIVNHLARLGELSEGIHRPAAIIRCVVGNKETPLFTGPTHCQNFTLALRSMVRFPVKEIHNGSLFAAEYEMAYRNAREGISTCLVEFKDLYSV